VNINMECEQEVDGRWIAEVSQLPGVLCYGKNANEAKANAEALAFQTMVERLERGQHEK
jgi:predicted RNase H-like HicB family nuclease